MMFGNSHVPQARRDAVYRGMFIDRKRVFVDLLGWDVPVLDGQFEVDQFDNERAIYLVLADSEGRHEGSLRLLPTMGATILGDLFPFLCDSGPPRSEHIWEITRLCLAPRLRAAERRRVRDHLASVLVDFALANGITSYCCVADAGWLSQILSFGWHCTPLGLPRMENGRMIGALQIEIGFETPRLMGQAGTWSPAPHGWLISSSPSQLPGV